MDCILLRHGIAVDREDWKGQEAQRPLTPKGTEKTREVVSGLCRLGLAPTHLFSSPFVRRSTRLSLFGKPSECERNWYCVMSYCPMHRRISSSRSWPPCQKTPV